MLILNFILNYLNGGKKVVHILENLKNVFFFKKKKWSHFILGGLNYYVFK